MESRSDKRAITERPVGNTEFKNLRILKTYGFYGNLTMALYQKWLDRKWSWDEQKKMCVVVRGSSFEKKEGYDGQISVLCGLSRM